MASTKISLQEDNILKLVLEFLSSRKLYKATRALEKEANVVNCPYSDSITFLRELVLDGEWEAVEDFAQPLAEIQEFDCRQFHFLVTKQKYLEILFEKYEGAVEDKQVLRDSLVSCLNLLEKCCPFKDEYNKLYWYLSVPSLRDEPEFANWNVDLSRMVVFDEIVSLLKPFIPVSGQNWNRKDVAPVDRLVSLLSKGLLYENCIEFCQKQAMHNTCASDFSVTDIQTDFFREQAPSSTGNFYSWLHSVPSETFAIPFDQLSVEVEVEKLKNKQGRADMRNNALSRSLTIESMTPSKKLLPGSNRMENKRLSDWQGMGRYVEHDFRDVSQSWANFDIGSISNKQGIPIGQADQDAKDGLYAKVQEVQIVDEGQFNTIQSPREIKNNQQETVLQRLEEHKKRQQELHQQLAEMTANLAKENVQEAWGEKDSEALNNGVALGDLASSQSLEALRKSKESFRFLNEGYESPNVGVDAIDGVANPLPIRKKGNDGASGKSLVNDNNRPVYSQTPPSSRPNPVESLRSSRISISDKDHNEAEAPKSPSMSTKLKELLIKNDQAPSPRPASTVKPNRISIPEEGHVEMSTTLPKTPVNRIFPPGSVNLSDGSGVFNTSTPKSHHHTYMTPPPPASPVMSEPDTTKSNVPLRQSHQNRMVKQEVEKKSNVDVFNQTPKSTADVKQLAVRRSLVHNIMEEKHKDDSVFTRKAEPGSTNGSVLQMNHGPKEMKFRKVAVLSDTQAVRSVAFHPSGKCFAVGTNSKALKVCAVRNLDQDIQSARSDLEIPEPDVVFKKIPIHRGSVYCVAFNAQGDIIATGSNDKIIKVLRFDEDNLQSLQDEMELAIHNATVRDLAFVNTAGSLPLLASGGAGGGLIHLSDCWTGQTVSSLKGHNGNIMTIFASAQANLLCSGSADKSVRVWDLRLPKCVDIVSSSSCVTSVCFSYGTDALLLASAQENGQCIIYDVSARKSVTSFHPHTTDCRSIRFSPDSRYILTGSYDANVAITAVPYNLDTQVLLESYTVATHRDKVIQCRWHPSQYTFLSSSADKTVALWTQEGR